MQVTRWIAGALALAGATVVAAQSVADRPTKEQREAARAQAFAQADADGNRALSPQEFETFKTLMSQLRKRDWFARADANHDGQITLDELQAARIGKHGCRDKAPSS
jgi:EF-hand domain pair